MIEVGAVSSENTNLVTGTVGAAPKSGGDDVVSMNFDDFLDMINPLEHIPVVSTIYRAVTGENINPVSRIAGDALYGGIFGLASAGLSALGAIGDEVFASANDGKTASSSVMASLFGDPTDEDQIQVASADAAPTTADDTPPLPPLALLQTPARQSPILDMPNFSASLPQLAAAPQAPVTPAAAPTAVAQNSDTSTPDLSAMPKGLPLDRSKQPYGGVMDSAMMQSAQQNQTLALAMAGGANALQAQRSIRNSRFAATTAPTTAAPAAGTAANATTPDTVADPQTQEAMQNLLKELQAMKSVDKYRNAAQSLPLPGNSVFNVTN